MATVVLVPLPRPVGRAVSALARCGRRLLAAHAVQVELAERRALLARPWEEEFLHWAREEDGWRLHGHRTPPGRRRRGTTRSGWCPGRRPARELPSAAGIDPRADR